MFFRVYVSGLMKGGADMFVENMPGFPDNIRPSSSGGYWVAAATIRANPGFSMLDFLSDKPFIKRMIFKVIMKIDSQKQDGNESHGQFLWPDQFSNFQGIDRISGTCHTHF